MRARTWLLAVAAAIWLATMAAAEPPINPLVARQFHQAQVPIAGYVASPEVTTPSAWATMTDMVWEALLDHLTFPLGAAKLPRDKLGA